MFASNRAVCPCDVCRAKPKPTIRHAPAPPLPINTFSQASLALSAGRDRATLSHTATGNNYAPKTPAQRRRDAAKLIQQQRTATYLQRAYTVPALRVGWAQTTGQPCTKPQMRGEPRAVRYRQGQPMTAHKPSTLFVPR